MKHVIAIVDANTSHSLAVAEALAASYTVHTYDSVMNALSGISITSPKVILVGQKVGAGSGALFIKDLRKDQFLARIPVIFIADSEDFRIVDQLREIGIRDRLVKPYSRKALMALISGHINGHVELAWQDLPSNQRKALESSLNSFNSIAEELAKGRPLPYQDIAESCSAVVEVVHSKELGSLLDQIKEHDNFTYVHSLRFAALMSMFGSAIGLPREQQVLVASGGMLHDIGMMTIPKSIMQKQGTLTPSEWDLVHNHVTTSEKVLATCSSIPKGVATIVKHHHERLDESGYPRHLSGRDLNQLARMAAIIDVFCGLTDRRPYKRTMAPHVALEMMAKEMNGQLDLELLYKFKEILLDTLVFPLNGEAAQ
ncbi:MAG TPA: HD domain-containing phosphohydrolase [Candidatus Sulfotelmatobacter sp.]|jgi:HD-GYP domain-containing protein (c-di-GMP phosphodiesterase class II)|nr:HD domain-containing phosphohydrolase [Candidatus Sulfotelmatobacter sp.]